MSKITKEKIIGIDIGGTKMRGVLWNGKKVLKTLQIDTPKNLADFKTAFSNVVHFLGKEEKIAVGMAGIVEKSILVKSPNIPYIKNVDFFALDSFNIKKLDNDARCFARAEYKTGGATGVKSVFFITLGTGVGRALGKNNKILKIKKLEYPEVWESEYQKIKDSKNNEKLIKYLAVKIKNLTTCYQSELIVIGGGLLKRKKFFKELKKEINIPIKRSAFSKNGVAIGAAMLICENRGRPKIF